MARKADRKQEKKTHNQQFNNDKVGQKAPEARSGRHQEAKRNGKVKPPRRPTLPAGIHSFPFPRPRNRLLLFYGLQIQLRAVRSVLELVDPRAAQSTPETFEQTMDQTSM